MKATRPVLTRATPLLDYEVERGGDGRTVTAYAATFNDPYEVTDFDGHYDEVISPSAFNRTLGRGINTVQVLFNHGRTIAGTPAAEFSMPIARAIEVKPDGKGLLTRSYYLKTPLGDQMLEMWREGAIRAQSFRGAIYRSSPPRPGPNGRPVIERHELGLVEYGPATFAVNNGASLVAIRSDLLDDRISDLTAEERAELARRLADTFETTPPPAAPAVIDPEPPADPAPPAPVDPGSSLQLLELAAAQRRRRA